MLDDDKLITELVVAGSLDMEELMDTLIELLIELLI